MFQYRPDPARDVGEVLHLLRAERAAEDGALAVGEPLLEHLVAAEAVVPDGGRDVAPERLAVEVDVEGSLAEHRKHVAHRRALIRREGAFCGAALARHHRVALAEMPPAGGDREVLARHVAPAGRGGDGDRGDLGPQRRARDAGDRLPQERDRAAALVRGRWRNAGAGGQQDGTEKSSPQHASPAHYRTAAAGREPLRVSVAARPVPPAAATTSRSGIGSAVKLVSRTADFTTCVTRLRATR